jgi:hypothetical protein
MKRKKPDSFMEIDNDDLTRPRITEIDPQRGTISITFPNTLYLEKQAKDKGREFTKVPVNVAQPKGPVYELIPDQDWIKEHYPTQDGLAQFPIDKTCFAYLADGATLDTVEKPYLCFLVPLNMAWAKNRSSREGLIPMIHKAAKKLDIKNKILAGERAAIAAAQKKQDEAEANTWPGLIIPPSKRGWKRGRKLPDEGQD